MHAYMDAIVVGPAGLQGSGCRLCMWGCAYIHVPAGLLCSSSFAPFLCAQGMSLNELTGFLSAHEGVAAQALHSGDENGEEGRVQRLACLMSGCLTGSWFLARPPTGRGARMHGWAAPQNKNHGLP